MVNRKLHHGPFRPWPPSAANITRGVSETNHVPLVCTGYLPLDIQQQLALRDAGVSSKDIRVADGN